MIFKTEYTPRVSDFDRFGRLSPSAVLSVLEDAGNRHAISADMGAITKKEGGGEWIMTEWYVKINRLPREGETFSVDTWLSGKIPSYILNRNMRAYKDGEELFTAEIKHALFNTENMTPIKFTPKLVAPYSPEEYNVFDTEPKRAVEPREWDSETEIYPRLSDIDINGHIHNTRYADIGAEISGTTDTPYRALRIVYRSPVLAGEKMTVKSTATADTTTVGIYTDKLCALVMFER